MKRNFGIVMAVISGVLIAAHFLRGGLYPLVTIAIIFPWLLLARRLWVTRMVQLLLILAAAEWIHTLLAIGVHRHAAGQPWIRMAIIIGGVALFTMGSAFAIRFKPKPSG